jgi:hypothetical protein
MSRNGKIARLPSGVRGMLNYRLRDGEGGPALLDWLNGLPEVQELVDERFGGVHISPQNLSEWRSGGYQEWLRHEESKEMVEDLMERADGLDEAADQEELSDWLSVLVSVELARTVEALLAETMEPKERWKLLREILPHLAALRREDHRALRVGMIKERWDRETERLDREKFIRDLLEKKEFQELERSRKAASPPLTSGQPATVNRQSEGPGQVQSNQIKPNQT